MKTWINFKELRAKLDFEKVLRHYAVEVKRRGGQLHAFCPLPKHHGSKNSPSFSANVARGIFQCFGCGQRGNILEFAAFMENVNPQDGTAFRALALRLQELFCPKVGTNAKQTASDGKVKALASIINSPLDFELQGLDPEHPYLFGRGFSQDTIRHFGLGFCSRGYLKDRIAISLHDHKGRLVGYAGRLVDDSLVSEDDPRYRFPDKREREGKVLEFQKSRLLYNSFRIEAPVTDLVVVEGFASVWWLHQHSQPQAVATMGADCSERQAELITSLVKPSGRVWIIPDGDQAGERFAHSVLLRISTHRFVRWMKLPQSRQPTDLSADEL